MKELKRAEKTLTSIATQIAELRENLKRLVMELPDNPKITRFKGDVSGYVIPSSAIFSQPSLRMDPFYYDFRAQYKLIADLIDNRPPEKLLKALTELMHTGCIAVDNKIVRFHPEVIDNLKKVL